MKHKLTFENQPCGRCGGSGHYSYCQMYGTVCFKCAGRKVVLTKRGAVAQALYTKLASKRAEQIVPGDVIWVDSVIGKFGWQAVISSGRPNHSGGYISPEGGVYQSLNSWVIETKDLTNHVSKDSVVRVRQSAEQRAAILDVCIAFERSLNKQGNPDKTLAKLMKEVAWS